MCSGLECFILRIFVVPGKKDQSKLGLCFVLHKFQRYGITI